MVLYILHHEYDIAEVVAAITLYRVHIVVDGVLSVHLRDNCANQTLRTVPVSEIASRLRQLR